jgi:MobA-like NTP transferase domain
MTNPMESTLVILAAGQARRFGGCKPLAPIGPNGEAVIDLLASDAVASGFTRLVLVLHPETGPAIRYHVEQCWPAELDVAFAVQRLPLGTVHALLAAEGQLDTGRPFAVSNADDIYSETAMGLLVRTLASGADHHVLVAFALEATIATDDPVTRGICQVDERGYLANLSERRQVTRHSHDTRFTADDGKEPETLPGASPTSVNLWGFQPSVWGVLHSAMDASGLDEESLLATAESGGEITKVEVLLPDVVAGMVADGTGPPVRVVTTDARMIGVTHAADLPVVSAELARQVAWGIRPSRPWGGRPPDSLA